MSTIKWKSFSAFGDINQEIVLWLKKNLEFETKSSVENKYLSQFTLYGCIIKK